MPNEIYPVSHFGVSNEVGFGSIYHHYSNTIVEPEEPEEPIIIKPPNGPIVVVPEEPEEPEEPKKKK